MTLQQKNKRLNWVKNWATMNFNNVIFMDEKRFSRIGDGPTRVWRRDGERFVQRFMSETTKFKGGSLMVWGCLTYDGPGPLFRCSNNMDQHEYTDILKKVLTAIPRLKSRASSKPILQHDGASVHTARSVEAFLRSQNVKLLPWPPLSPDLNPIENVWGYIAKKMVGKCFPTFDSLWDEIERHWKALSVDYIRSLYHSMPMRLEAVRKSGGWPTKY